MDLVHPFRFVDFSLVYKDLINTHTFKITDDLYIRTPPQKIRSPKIVRIVTLARIIHIFVLICLLWPYPAELYPKSKTAIHVALSGTYILQTNTVILR